MKQTKQWFAYLPLDRKGVETYLNDQAEKGWALAVEQDGMTFRVPFQETSRTDLRYHVTCDAYQGEKAGRNRCGKTGARLASCCHHQPL